MFLGNMIGALILIPALSYFLLRTPADFSQVSDQRKEKGERKALRDPSRVAKLSAPAASVCTVFTEQESAGSNLKLSRDR
ncbi:hypothetical protein D3C84_1036770 [compost metagenome]